MDESIQFVDSFGNKEFWKNFLDTTNDEMADLLEVNTKTDNAACSSSDIVPAIGEGCQDSVHV